MFAWKCFLRQLYIHTFGLIDIGLSKWTYNYPSHTSFHVTPQTVKLHSHQLCLFSKLSNQYLLKYKCIVPPFLHITCEPSLSNSISNFYDSINSAIRHFFKRLKTLSMAPKRKLTRSSTKSERGESSKSLMAEPITPSIPSP